MNRSIIWLLVLPAVVATGCREVCSRDEIRYGDRCVLRPDSGSEEDASGDADDVDFSLDDGGSLTDAAQSDAASEAGEIPLDATSAQEPDGCTTDQGHAACASCPEGFFANGTSCQRGSIDVAPGTTACAIQSDGTLWCWGRRPGEVAMVDPAPVQIATRQGWEQVEAAEHPFERWFACAIREGGLYCWGDNASGQLGLGTTGDPVVSPTRIGSESTWQAVSPGWTGLGNGYACGIRSGALFCWGSDKGLLGVAPDGGDDLAPVRVGARTDWTSISAGGTTACGIADGELWCWTHGQSPAMTTAWTDWTQISAGFRHVCAIRQGELNCWGDNESGAVGVGEAGLDRIHMTPTRIGTDSDWTFVSAGYDATCAIRAGQLYCWGLKLDTTYELGESAAPSPIRIGEATDWHQVSVTGGGRACGIHNNGQVDCWGLNTYGEIGTQEIPTPQSCAPRQVGTAKDWTAVAAGNGYSCGIRAREMYCWGSLQLSASGSEYSALPAFAPQRVGSDSDWQTISLYPSGFAGDHACGIRNGHLYCWGESSRGQLGTGEADLVRDVQAPVQVGTSTWTEVSVGWQATCARSGGSVSCWGQGPLTDPTPLQPVPYPLQHQDWTTIAVGSPSSVLAQEHCGLRLGQLWCWSGVGPSRMLHEVPRLDGAWTHISTGSTSHHCGVSGRWIYCWGDNESGQLGLGATSVGVHHAAPARVGGEAGTWLAVSAAQGRSCGIRTDWREPTHGDLWCWGSREMLGLGDCAQGIVADPAQIPGSWSTISLGYRHACAIAADGGLWCWGEHSGGAAGHGPYWSPTPVPVEWPPAP